MRSLVVALILLFSLPAAQDLDALFRDGMAAVEEAYAETDEDRRDALLDEAIAAFRAMLVARPDLVRMRLELARAFFLKGEDSFARRHFEDVFAGNVPDEVKANVELFFAEIRARRRWSFNLGVAVAPDTNIGAGSEEHTIIINCLPFQRDAEELTTSGVGLSFWGGAEYQAPISRPAAHPHRCVGLAAGVQGLRLRPALSRPPPRPALACGRGDGKGEQEDQGYNETAHDGLLARIKKNPGVGKSPTPGERNGKGTECPSR